MGSIILIIIKLLNRYDCFKKETRQEQTLSHTCSHSDVFSSPREGDSSLI